MRDNFIIRMKHGFEDYSNYKIKLNKKVNEDIINKIKENINKNGLYLMFNNLSGSYWTYDRLITTKTKDYDLLFKEVKNNIIYFDLIERKITGDKNEN